MNEEFSASAKSAAPAPFWIVIALLGLQALAVFGGAVWDILGIAGVVPSAAPTSVELAAALAVLLLVMGVWIVLAIRWCFEARGIGRASAFALIVFQFAIGLGLLQGDEAQPALAGLILLPAIAAAIALLSGPVTAWFAAGGPRRDAE